MKVAIDHEQLYPIYFVDAVGPREFDIPEAQVHWINDVFVEFHKAQDYLRAIHAQGPLYNRG